ncbi:MAG: KEOPS complex subunit Cgi121 [Promethearchaeota archaeon]
MIIKDFDITELNLKYFVGISQIKMNLDKFMNFYNIMGKNEALNQFLNIMDEVQNEYENTVVQFIMDKYILNQDHIFIACYHFLKAFQLNFNISNKKNIEFLLYMATNRQINKSIEAFGVNFSQLNHNNLILCIVSPINNLKIISEKLLSTLNAEKMELSINKQSHSKFNMIKEFFEINNNQINSVLRSYGIDIKKSVTNLPNLFSALFDLICEKMSILFLQ